MRELSQEEFNSRSNAIFGGSDEGTERITVSGSFIPYSSAWAASMYAAFNDMLADISTQTIDTESLDIEPTLDNDGTYSLESFVDDITNLTAEEKAQFSESLGDMSNALGLLVETAIANGANISPQTLTDIGNLSKGLGAIGTAIEAGALATKFAAGDFSTGTVADALNLVATVAVGTALGGPVGFAAAFATAMFGDEAIEFALEAAVDAGELTIAQYNEVAASISLSITSSGIDFGDINYWHSLFGIPTGIGGGWNE
jgi:hypothetical protein